MVLTAINTAIAAAIVYMTAKDKLKFDADKLGMLNKIAWLEAELKRKEGL